jgi:hypothetical protein
MTEGSTEIFTVGLLDNCMEGTLDDFSVGEKVVAIVGSSEGVSEGSWDGTDDVAMLGCSVGDVETWIGGIGDGESGLSYGMIVGAGVISLVGRLVGWDDGFGEGLWEGGLEGVTVGNCEGFQDGSVDGIADDVIEGAEEGSCVG